MWLLVSPSPPPRRLLVGVDDDTLKWTSRPLEVVAAQRRLGADAVRVWVPWSGEAGPGPNDALHLFDRFVSEIREAA